MELRQLEYLIAVADEASFSAAARRLGVQQPSISEQIRKLETQVGQPLLDRLPRRVVPTPAGQQLIEHGRRILAEVAEATRRAGEASTQPVGKLTVGAIPTIAPFLLPQLLRGFEREHPSVELIVIEETTPRLVELIGRGELDLAIASTTPPASHLQVETIGVEPLCLMMSTRHKLAKTRQLAWDAIGDERFVALHEMHCLANQSEQFCLRRKLRPPVVMHGSNLFTLASMVAIGMGVSLVPQMMADCGACVFRGCAFRAFKSDRPTRPITLLWSLLRYRTLAAREFERMVRRTLALRS
jgi:LysR family hydrogen peroxide-inducible transcriptional activator